MDNNTTFTALDTLFAEFICELANDKALFMPAALASKHVCEGHSCTDLTEVSEWLSILKGSDVVGNGGDYKPLIIENNRLYLQKYWQYETTLADAIKKMINHNVGMDITEAQKGLLGILFDDDCQKASVENSIRNNFSIISGGPGTGKTTTIAKLLYILFSRNYDLNIAVCAPTGKASARISESITRSIEQIKKGFIKNHKEELIDEKVMQKIVGLKGQTIHRLISERQFVDPLSSSNKLDEKIGFDILVVDEASMIDLTIMSKLISWAKTCTKVIIIGDKDQLFSVDSGSVMNELCNCDKLKNNTTVLTKSWRFEKKHGIGELSKSINSAAPIEQIVSLFKTYTEEQGILYSDHDSVKKLYETIKPDVIRIYGKISTASSPEEALSYYESLRILCAVKQGPFGVYEINKMVEHILEQEGTINTTFNEWYNGRPIMITKNDVGYGLFNGDSGIIYKGKAYFKLASHEKIKDFIPTLLPEHETSYAVTVHKSQGSEFDKVFIVLPQEDNRILSRQLIYTAVTRAKECAHLIAPTEVFRIACTRSVTRRSGLAEKINTN